MNAERAEQRGCFIRICYCSHGVSTWPCVLCVHQCATPKSSFFSSTVRPRPVLNKSRQERSLYISIDSTPSSCLPMKSWEYRWFPKTRGRDAGSSVFSSSLLPPYTSLLHGSPAVVRSPPPACKLQNWLVPVLGQSLPRPIRQRSQPLALSLTCVCPCFCLLSTFSSLPAVLGL